MLPDMHGKEVFRRLRERMPDLPVIMLTAKGDPLDRVIGSNSAPTTTCQNLLIRAS